MTKTKKPTPAPAPIDHGEAEPLLADLDVALAASDVRLRDLRAERDTLPARLKEAQRATDPTAWLELQNRSDDLDRELSDAEAGHAALAALRDAAAATDASLVQLEILPERLAALVDVDTRIVALRRDLADLIAEQDQGLRDLAVLIGTTPLTPIDPAARDEVRAAVTQARNAPVPTLTDDALTAVSSLPEAAPERSRVHGFLDRLATLADVEAALRGEAKAFLKGPLVEGSRFSLPPQREPEANRLLARGALRTYQGVQALQQQFRDRTADFAAAYRGTYTETAASHGGAFRPRNPGFELLGLNSAEASVALVASLSAALDPPEETS